MSDTSTLRDHMAHYDGCALLPVGCPECVEAQTAVMEGASKLLLDLGEAKVDRAHAQREAAELQIELNESLQGDDGEQALANWALDYGAELATLRASPRTYEVARLALQARGGPACPSYENKDTLDLCKCGRPFREHTRELVRA